MGFFGNIGDTSKIHFQFDKIYNTRYEMDQAAAAGNDGVFSGRFVLVRYDINDLFFASSIKNAYYHEGHMYSDLEHTIPLYFTTFSLVNSPQESDWNSYFYKQGDYYYKLPSEEYFSSDERNYYIKDASQDNVTYAGEIIRAFDNTGNPSQNYYYCATDNTNGTIANFIDVYSENNNQFLENNLYFQNYQIDRIHYGTDLDWHGYDATVWQKVYSEGNGKFILIARLSAIVPSIELIADAPSTTPSGAYIDNLSSDVKYRIHMPSNWGFRIKEVQTNEETEELVSPSDQQVIQTYYEYDDNNQLISEVNKQINADIYFNKDGSIRATRHYDDSTQNEILITPTGESGKVYYDSNGQRQTIDTYELAVHLPVIGNLLSDFYDIFYGRDRKLDTEWYNGDQQDLIANGNIALNGKTRDLNTFAGVVNVAQDRLGQIIIPVDNLGTTSAAALDEKYIYATEDNGEIKYFRKGIDYIYTAVPEYSSMGALTADEYEINTYWIKNGNSYNLATQNYNQYPAGTIFYRKNITYTEVNLTAEQYEPNTYYYRENGNYVIADRAYPEYFLNGNTTTFYKKDVSIFKFTEVQLTKYEADTYYYNDGSGNYIRDDTEQVPAYRSRPYYTVNIIPESKTYISENFDGGTFGDSLNPLFYQNDDEYFVKVNEDTQYDETISYYKIISSSQINSGNPSILYQKNKYFYYNNYVNGQPVGDPQVETSDDLMVGRTYYYIPILDTPETAFVDGEIKVVYPLDVDNKVIVNLISIASLNEENIYAEIGSGNQITYIPLNKIKNLNVQYRYMNIVFSKVNKCFIPNEYYVEQNYNYYLAQDLRTNVTYYPLSSLNIVVIPHPFYESGKYYYNNGNIYLIDTAVGMTDNRVYYVYTPLYVLEDTSQRWPYGFEWQEQALFVPASVTLATREEVSNIFEIKGINNGESSINGSILTFNKYASFNDIDTRDTTTLTGAINAINDLLQSVKTNLIPKRILYINDFGQISVSSITIDQLENLINN